jgi:hypothetical protein
MSTARPLGSGIVLQALNDLALIEQLARNLQKSERVYPYCRMDAQEIVRIARGVATDVRGLARLLDSPKQIEDSPEHRGERENVNESDSSVQPQ